MAYVMFALQQSRNLRRGGYHAEALKELYDLIPDLDPEIQDKLQDIEAQVEDLWRGVKQRLTPGSEYSIAVEFSQQTQIQASRLEREIRRKIMKELFVAGYFEYERQGYNFYNPSEGRTSGGKSAGFGKTVKRTM
jgi:hypothetical protein